VTRGGVVDMRLGVKAAIGAPAFCLVGRRGRFGAGTN